MITERVSDNQNVSVSEIALDNYRTMGDSVYSAESTTYSEEYREHLDKALHNQCVAIAEEEYEDMCRYARREQRDEAREEAATTATVIPNVVKLPQKTQQETVRVFNQKRAIWLAVYVLLAIGVVLALLFTMPGTAWERKSITVDTKPVEALAEADATVAAPAGINTIYTLDGQSVTVELQPYAEQKPETNWFDQLCDWLNNAIGG